MLPIYTRFLTPTDYGVLEIAEATTSMLGLVASIGIVAAMSRFYFEQDRQEDRNAVVSTVVWLVVFSATIMALCLIPLTTVLSSILFESTDYSRLLALAIVGLAIGLVVDTALMYCRVINWSGLYIVTSLATLIMSTALNVYFIVIVQYGPIGMIYATLISRLIILVPLVVWMSLRVGLRYRSTLATDMIRFSLPLIPADLAHTIVGYSDRFFINHFVSTAAAGMYGIAMRFGTILHVLVTSPFITSFLPRRFEIARDKGAPGIFASIFDAYSFVILVLTTGISVFSYEIVAIFTEERFHNAALYIPAASLGMVILGFKYHFQFGIFYRKKTTVSMYINIFSMSIHLLSNYLLVPRFGLWGAISAFLVATTINVLLYLIYGQKYFRIPYDWIRLLKLTVASLIAFYASTFVGFSSIYVDIAAKTAIFLLYSGALFCLGLINLEALIGVLKKSNTASST